MATYELHISDASGNILPGGIVSGRNIVGLEIAYAVNQIGHMTVDIPSTTLWPYLAKDGRILVQRAVSGAAPYVEGERAWLIRRRQLLVGERGVQSIRISATDANDILRRRIVDYNAGSSETSKTAAADDVMKAIVRENFVSATDTTRNLASALFGVSADVSAGASVSKAFARRNVLVVLQELADASTQAGTYLAFDIAWTGSRHEFRTYTGQRGIDHSSDSGDPVLIGPDMRNLTDVAREDDWSEEVTRTIAGGQGIANQREISRASDTTLSSESPLGLIEDFVQANMAPNTTVLAAEANAALRAQRPRRVLRGRFVETPGAVYGLHFGFGDLLAGQVVGEQVDFRVDAVRLSLRNGREDVDIRLRSEL